MINKGILCIQYALACFCAADGAENPTGFVVVFIFIKQPQQQHCIIILSPSDCRLSVCQGNCCCKWLTPFVESTSSLALGARQWADNRLTGNNYSPCVLSTGYTVLRLISSPDISDLIILWWPKNDCLILLYWFHAFILVLIKSKQWNFFKKNFSLLCVVLYSYYCSRTHYI